MSETRPIETWLTDMDGVLVHEEHPIPGAQEFVEALQQNNQLPAIVGEVARNKALAVALGKVTVVDTNGKTVDLTGFVAADDEAADEEEVVDEAQEIADSAADADEVIEAEEAAVEAEAKPAKKKAAAKKK